MAAKTLNDLTNKQLLVAIAHMIDTLTDAIADMFALQAEQMATKDDIARLEQKFERMREGLAQAAKPI